MFADQTIVDYKSRARNKTCGKIFTVMHLQKLLESGSQASGASVDEILKQSSTKVLFTTPTASGEIEMGNVEAPAAKFVKQLAKVGRNWPNLDQPWSMFAKVWPNSVRNGQMLAESGELRVNMTPKLLREALLE